MKMEGKDSLISTEAPMGLQAAPIEMPLQHEAPKNQLITKVKNRTRQDHKRLRSMKKKRRNLLALTPWENDSSIKSLKPQQAYPSHGLQEQQLRKRYFTSLSMELASR